MNFEIFYSLTKTQIQDLCQLYASTWWAENRQPDQVQQMLQQSDVVIALCDRETHQLVAFARVLTDYIYRALLLDVIVREDYRDRGLGRLLMETIMTHPQLQSVEAFLLICKPDLVPFYEKWGFTTADTLQLMGKVAPALALSQSNG